MRSQRAVALAACWLCTASVGCLVEEKCYQDADCKAPEVCSKSGECAFECRIDQDCSRGFGVEYVCEAGHCRYPVQCTLCRFEHAAASCIHGSCAMGDCEANFHDANHDDQDGCEYECELSAAGVEVCDGVDNDCDNLIDEETDFSRDPRNCGSCGHVCAKLPHADVACESGRCVYTCQAGWHDNNGQEADGCEASECQPATEICDGRDNDCDCTGDTNQDGVYCGPGDAGVDEGFDHTLVSSCGPFCVVCSYAHAEARCVDGDCEMGDCQPGWHDIDQVTGNGCEYRCTSDGAEICDGVDNDCDGQIDEGGVCGAVCPADMVAVGSAFCIDAYEASRPDATETNLGLDETIATSRPGVLPWMVRPMSQEQLGRFQSACAAAGKRLCTADEWFAACTGPEQNPYVYGDTFDRETCNCVDTYCDDHCEAAGIEASACSLLSNCGYTYNCFHVVPTGEFSACTNAYGTLDINGNVWEIVLSDSDSRGYEVRGGAFNCAGASVRVSCDFNAGWTDLYAGFRCCQDPP